MFRRQVVATVALLLLFLPSLSAAAEPLRVALSPDYPPLAFREDGELRGMEVGQMAIVLAGRAVQLAPPRALYEAGRRIGVESGTTGEDFAREEYPQAELLPYVDPQAAFAALRSREIDAYLHDAPTSWNLARSAQDGDLLSLYRPLTRERLAWAVKKGNSKLQRQLNGALAELRANCGLEAIRRRWIPVTVEIR